MSLIFGPTAIHAKCKCGKPPKETHTNFDPQIEV
jgi:hypothetical protein